MARNSLFALLRALLVVAGLGFGGASHAVELRQFEVAGGDEGMRKALVGASLLASAGRDGQVGPRDILAAAQADYARFLRVLYARGHYSGVIHIRLNGREAAAIPTFAVPARIDDVRITIDPGPLFRFGRAEIAPLAPGSAAPAEFRAGAPARSEVLQDTVDGAVEAWRMQGHAKARLSDQRVSANHAQRALSAQLRLSPGPRVRFGRLRQEGESAVRARRIQRIAGLPTGEVFSPDALEKVAKRLRRTGAFSSVALSEDEALGPGNAMDIGLTVVDAKPRRFGFGAELSSLEGLMLSGFWMHRNLLGGAERFKLDGEVSGIGGQSGGVDYSLGARLDIPAVFGTDTRAFVYGETAYLDEPGFRSWQSILGVGAGRIFSDRFEAELGVALGYSETSDSFGDRQFLMLLLPGEATWDDRDDALNPTRGYYLHAEAMPFMRLDASGGGVRAYADGRAYRGMGGNERFVLAGRIQAGSVFGASILDVPPEFLFFSGGGGTVRGQPYQSLGVDMGGGNIRGGKAFLGASAELRAKMSEKISVVGFVDAGYVGADGFFDSAGAWHSGGGIGVRYDTGIGPLRLDVAGPISGSTGDGVQLYIGIGQAF